MHHRWATTRVVVVMFVVASSLLAACVRTSPYIADAGPDRTVSVGTLVELEGRVLRVEDGQPVGVENVLWAFLERPSGSDAQLEVDGGPAARFVPDVAGDYVVEMRTSIQGWPLTDQVTIIASSEPVLLPGAPDGPAVSATFDFSFPLDRDPALIEAVPDAPDGARVHRGEIEIAFDPAATVGELNALLERLGARIVDMLPDHPQVVVRIPDPGSLAALRALVDAIVSDPIVDFVLLSLIVEPPVTEFGDPAELGTLRLPGGAGTRYERVDHQLAIRSHAAWNAREAIVEPDRRPWLVVPDFYGAGLPDPAYYDATFAATDFATGAPQSHGYHVLGIMIGAFDTRVGIPAAGSLEQENDDVTGVVPATLRVRVVDLQADNTLPRNMNRTIDRINRLRLVDPSARIIVNTSLGNRTLAEDYARSWTRKVRGWLDATTVGAGLEHRFLHFTAAGNVDVDAAGNVVARWPAVEESAYAYAALGDMSSTLFRDYPNLTNILVVENRINTLHMASGPRPLPSCANDRSIMGGTLSAIGTDVYSFGTFDRTLGLQDVGTPGLKSGTSMASPQAAGVAALVWSLAPSLSVPQVRDLLLATALDDPGGSGSDCNAVAPQPVVDAYAATLAAGGGAAWRAILDVDGNGRFDEGDLELFVAAFADLGATLDYGRFDLNGDGFTGELTRSERVDLDGDGLYGRVNRTVVDRLGRGVGRSFDEGAVNDFDVLCYHAYGPPYAGDPDARNARIGDRCAGGPIVTITLPREGDVFSGNSDNVFRATLTSTAEPPADVSADTIYWSYRRVSGELVRLGTTTSGGSLLAQTVCARTTVTAEVTRGIDTVTFTTTNPRAGPWRAVITSPATHTFHVDVDALAGGLNLAGEARRITCDGDDVDTGGLRWLDETRTLLGSGPALALPANHFDGSATFRERRVTLSYESGLAETMVRLVPCSTRPGTGVFACPELWPELRTDMLDRHRLLAELLDPDAMRQSIDAEIDLLLGGGAATPFPLPIPQLLTGITESVSPALRSRLIDLLETTTMGSLSEFEAGVRDLEARVAQDQDLSAAELAMLSQAIGVATVAAAVYAPASEGGDDGWQYFPFADPNVVAEANALVPVQSALRGFLTGYLATRSGASGSVEPYDVVRSRAAGIEGAVIGGLDALQIGAD